MDLVEVHKGVWQLSQYVFCAAAVHQVHTVPFKRVHETLGNAVRLRAAYLRVHRFNPKCAHQWMWDWRKSKQYQQDTLIDKTVAPAGGFRPVRQAMRQRALAYFARKRPLLCKTVDGIYQEIRGTLTT